MSPAARTRSRWKFSHANTDRNFSGCGGLHRTETTPGGHSAIRYRGFWNRLAGPVMVAGA